MKKAIIFFILFLVLYSKNVLAGTEDLLITEIMYDYPGGDNGHEWIEVYNNGEEILEVLIGSGGDTWRFFDGTKHILNLYQGTTTILSKEYFIIAQDAEQFLVDYPDYDGNLFDTVMSLKNVSSSVALSFDGGETLSCAVDYESIWGGVGDGNSLQYDIDSGQWNQSFILGGTPGSTNATSTVEEEIDDGGVGEEENNNDDNEEEYLDEEEVDSPDNFDETVYWRDIFISELLPNPIGSDEEEWIELYNKSYQEVDISGFILQDNTTRLYKIEEGTYIGSQEYLVFYKSKTKISLNNTGGDMVSLYDPQENLRDRTEYLDLAPEGSGYAKKEYSFSWTVEPTPGKSNVFPNNQAPKAEIEIKSDKFIVGEAVIFSAELSSDPEEATLLYSWDFGDDTSGDEVVENHIFDAPGKYQVSLEVADNEGDKDMFSVIVDIEGETVDINIQEIPKINFELDNLIISEFIPNPVGSDDGEWIELYNNSDTEINLLAWQLDDEEGGSKPFVFADNFFIAPYSYVVLDRSETKITLNNTNDSVRLLTPLSEVWQEVLYEKIVEGNSWAWDLENKEWYINEEPSPGYINVAEEINFIKKENTIYSTNEIKDLAKGESITTQGIILYEPVENKSSLYVASWDGQNVDFDNLVEVYSYYKDFPKLEKGQIVFISGEISKLGDVPRIKINSKEQIVENDLKIDLPKLDIWSVEDLDLENIGTWIRVRGMVVKKRSNDIYLAVDTDEEYNLRARSMFLADDLEINKGTEVIVTGVLSDVSGKFRLDVWGQEYISLSQSVLGEKISSTSVETITTTQKEVDFSANDSQSNKIWFFIVGGLFLLIVIYLLDKKYLHK